MYLLGFAGIALFTGLLIREGVSQVMEHFVAPKWLILGIVAYHSIPLFLDTFAWWVLFPKPERPTLLGLYWMRWIGESVSTLVPSATVGGEIVRARLAAIQGTALATSAGTVIVDLTVGIFVQAGLALVGLALLVQASGKTEFVVPTLWGMTIAVAAFAGFFLAQRRGMFGFITRLLSRFVQSEEWQGLVQGGERLDQKVRTLYSLRGGLLICIATTIVSFTVASGEVWIALVAMNLNPSILHAFILQTMIYAIRSAAFAVPAGIGVQEGGYIFVGSLLGIPGDAAFALSLIARMRELGVGIPGLILWQLVEGRRLLRTRTEPSAS